MMMSRLVAGHTSIAVIAAIMFPVNKENGLVSQHHVSDVKFEPRNAPVPPSCHFSRTVKVSPHEECTHDVLDLQQPSLCSRHDECRAQPANHRRAMATVSSCTCWYPVTTNSSLKDVLTHDNRHEPGEHTPENALERVRMEIAVRREEKKWHGEGHHDKGIRVPAVMLEGGAWKQESWERKEEGWERRHRERKEESWESRQERRRRHTKIVRAIGDMRRWCGESPSGRSHTSQKTTPLMRRMPT